MPTVYDYMDELNFFVKTLLQAVHKPLVYTEELDRTKGSSDLSTTTDLLLSTLKTFNNITDLFYNEARRHEGKPPLDIAKA